MGKEIVIVVSGGVVQSITGAPEDYRVVVRDYDVNDLPFDDEGKPEVEEIFKDQIKEDEDGDFYEELVFQ